MTSIDGKFIVTWIDFQDGKIYSEEVEQYQHARRMAAELRQLGVKQLAIVGKES